MSQVVFWGWRPGILTVSLIRSIREVPSYSLADAKRFVDALVNLPALTIEAKSPIVAKEVVAGLMRDGAYLESRQATIRVFGCAPELHALLRTTLSSASFLPAWLSEEATTAWLLARCQPLPKPIDEVLASALCEQANAFGAIARVAEGPPSIRG